MIYRRPAGRAAAGAAASLVLALAAGACGEPERSLSDGGPAELTTSTPSPPVVSSAETLLTPRPVFGVHLKNPADVATIVAATGCEPQISELFAAVPNGISSKTLNTAPGLLLLSIEPWHTGEGANQGDFTLAATVDGRWDSEYRRLAKSLVSYQRPVLVRFAHEMNGRWYPWGVANGNKPGEFIKAHRHVVDLFRAAGAVNALWVWSPNVVRGAASQTIAEFWPGEPYVDVVGLTGYGVRETSPDKTYGKTLSLVKALTRKPILLTEVGVKADPTKQAWIKTFGPWLKANPQIAGFIWNQVVRDGDWRFDDSPENLAAFVKSLDAAGVAC